MKWRWREGVERNANPNILRECWTFLIRIFLHQLRKQLSRILHFQTQEKFADIWLVLTIQTVIPVGLGYLTFACKNKQGNHCSWHKSFKELRLRKVQHYQSSLKEEKTLAVLIPLHCIKTESHLIQGNGSCEAGPTSNCMGCFVTVNRLFMIHWKDDKYFSCTSYLAQRNYSEKNDFPVPASP